jgi:hypothetical protein
MKPFALTRTGPCLLLPLAVWISTAVTLAQNPKLFPTEKPFIKSTAPDATMPAWSALPIGPR